MADVHAELGEPRDSGTRRVTTMRTWVYQVFDTEYGPLEVDFVVVRPEMATDSIYVVDAFSMLSDWYSGKTLQGIGGGSAREVVEYYYGQPVLKRQHPWAHTDDYLHCSAGTHFDIRYLDETIVYMRVGYYLDDGDPYFSHC
jgi:hypothetical protein